MTRIDEIKKEISSIRREQVHIESIIAKQEDEGVYDDSLYKQLDKLDSKCESLQTELDSIIV